MNIPNYLTIFRILLIPIFVIFFYLPGWGRFLSAVIFAIACITDWFDGYLARSWGQTSKLGEFLDPVADKLLVAVALVLLVGEQHISYLAIPAAVIVGREIVVSALREWMAELGKRTSVAVSYVGKLKTFIQMISLVLLLAYQPAWPSLLYVGSVLLYVAAGLTIWSMFMYLKIAWPQLVMMRKEEENKKLKAEET